MLKKLHTFTLRCIDALAVEVEVDVFPGGDKPNFNLVGLPDTAVKESVHRIERAIVNSGYTFPNSNVTINLAPANLPKQVASLDVPMALGILAAEGMLGCDRFADYAVVGELALDGSIPGMPGVLSMAMEAAADPKIRGIVVPRENESEAAVVEDVEVIGVSSLTEAASFLSGAIDRDPCPSNLDVIFEKYSEYLVDYADVRGQDVAKRAMTIAAAGGHNVMMIGPPGSGKTMLAKRLPTILPNLSPEESIETTRIYSSSGRLPRGMPLMATRPFRSPHHTISNVGIVGGGATPMPGEISLSHNGVLFLDELPEFSRRTLEVLRQPLEDGYVAISRALISTKFPCDFVLVTAMNPCPCGHRGDTRRECHCSPPQVERYMSKISGPLLDRIDLHIEVPAVPFKELADKRPGLSSAEMKEQVFVARKIQQERFAGSENRFNASMQHDIMRKHCELSRECTDILRGAVSDLGLSARAHDKILRVARTIADLEEKPHIQTHHLYEAINYRMLDREIRS